MHVTCIHQLFTCWQHESNSCAATDYCSRMLQSLLIMLLKQPPTTEATMSEVAESLRGMTVGELTHFRPPNTIQQEFVVGLVNTALRNCVMLTDAEAAFPPDTRAALARRAALSVEVAGALAPGLPQTLSLDMLNSPNMVLSDLLKGPPTPVFGAAVSLCVTLLGCAIAPASSTLMRPLYPVLARLPTLLAEGLAIPKLDQLLTQHDALASDAVRAAAIMLDPGLLARNPAVLQTVHIGLPAAAVSLAVMLQEAGVDAAAAPPPAAFAALKAWHRTSFVGEDSPAEWLPVSITQSAAIAAMAVFHLLHVHLYKAGADTMAIPQSRPAAVAAASAVLATSVEAGAPSAIAHGLEALRGGMAGPSRFCQSEFHVKAFLTMGQVLAMSCGLRAGNLPFLHESLLPALADVLDIATYMHDNMPAASTKHACNIWPATSCRCFKQEQLAPQKLCQGLLMEAAVALNALVMPYRKPANDMDQLTMAQRYLLLSTVKAATRAAGWALQLCQSSTDGADCSKCLAAMLYQLTGTLYSVLNACMTQSKMLTAYDSQLWADIRIFLRRLNTSRPVQRFVIQHGPHSAPGRPPFADITAGLGRLVLLQEHGPRQVPVEERRVRLLWHGAHVGRVQCMSPEAARCVTCIRHPWLANMLRPHLLPGFMHTWCM